MHCTGFSQQSLLLGDIVFSVIGGRYTGSVSPNKQLLYRGQSCPDETGPHTYITEYKSKGMRFIHHGMRRISGSCSQFSVLLFHLSHSLSRLYVCQTFCASTAIIFFDVETFSVFQRDREMFRWHWRGKARHALLIPWSDNLFWFGIWLRYAISVQISPYLPRKKWLFISVTEENESNYTCRFFLLSIFLWNLTYSSVMLLFC